jgi:4'-phosphopantetheinyl transferase EntD
MGDYPLMPGEVLPHAVPARLREFAAGRHAARMAMQAAGLPAVALPMGADRAPLWPDGVIGSLTHTRSLCLAVAGQAGAPSGIGIDLEPATPLQRNLWDSILLPEEQIALMRAPVDQRGLLAKTVFSAKEAAYKAQYPTSRTLFGFEVMVIELAEDRFTAIFRDPIPPFAAGYRIKGRIIVTDGHIVTLAHM